MKSLRRTIACVGTGCILAIPLSALAAANDLTPQEKALIPLAKAPSSR